MQEFCNIEKATSEDVISVSIYINECKELVSNKNILSNPRPTQILAALPKRHATALILVYGRME